MFRLFVVTFTVGPGQIHKTASKESSSVASIQLRTDSKQRLR